MFFTDPDGIRLEVTNYRQERRERHDHQWQHVPADPQGLGSSPRGLLENAFDEFNLPTPVSTMTRTESTAIRLLRAVSLDALRGFESAARHLSFTAAAEELCLTQSAVSKQVKSLEETIGRSVFHRTSRGISLTSDGRLLYDGVRTMLDQLGHVLEQIVQSNRTSVAVSVTPSMASLWLVHKLQRFRNAEPAIDVRIDGSESVVALEREGFDVAVRLADPAMAATSWKPLTRERIMLVAAPEVARRVTVASDLLNLALLVFHDPKGRFPWMSWASWLERLGLLHDTQQPVFHFSQYEHLIKAATEGVGVAIGRTPLVLPFLHDGRLEVVLPLHVAEGMTYHLAVSERSAHRDEVRRFSSWIEQEMAQESLS